MDAFSPDSIHLGHITFTKAGRELCGDLAVLLLFPGFLILLKFSKTTECYTQLLLCADKISPLINAWRT